MTARTVIRTFVDAFKKLLSRKDWPARQARDSRRERRQNGYDSVDAAFLGRRRDDGVGGES